MQEQPTGEEQSRGASTGESQPNRDRSSHGCPVLLGKDTEIFKMAANMAASKQCVTSGVSLTQTQPIMGVLHCLVSAWQKSKKQDGCQDGCLWTVYDGVSSAWTDSLMGALYCLASTLKPQCLGALCRALLHPQLIEEILRKKNCPENKSCPSCPEITFGGCHRQTTRWATVIAE